jgi:hypothetical protein
MSIGRMDVHQIVNTLMAVVNYNDANVANGNVFGTLPKYATIVGIQVNIDTAFNAGTTNGLTLGTAAGGNQIATTTDTGSGTTGAKVITTGLATAETTADTPLYVTYTQTGTAASAGMARIAIQYVIRFSAFQ